MKKIAEASLKMVHVRPSTKEERAITIEHYMRRIESYFKLTPGGQLTPEVMIKFVNDYYLDNIKCLGDKYHSLNNKDKRLYDYLAIRIATS